MEKIYIIRHGETSLNAQGVLQGWLDENLNDNGIRLTEITGREMREIRFDACISSPLKRARETAEIILRESGNDRVPIFFDDRIKEINFGRYEGRKLIGGELPDSIAEKFFKDPFGFPGFPGGEDLYQVCTRTQDFLRELCDRDDGKTYLVSTHGCALRGMLNHLYINQNDYWHGHVPYNCVVNIVEVNSGNASLIVDDRIYYDPSEAVDQYTKS